MRVAIITLTHVYNFGNSLQNYAVQETLKEMGLIPETIISDFITVKQQFKNTVKILIKKILLCYGIKEKRIASFHKFEKNYIKFSPFKNIYTTNTRVNNRYAYFILGSDQVWNPSWYTEKRKQAFLLTFAEKNKKVCFSPSFGLHSLPEEWESWFQHKLNYFSFLSVREKSGQDIIKRLIGKKATVLIDPTLMLDKNKWLKIAVKPKNINFNDDYILTYFLGGINEKYKCDIKKIASEYKLKIYNLLDQEQPNLYTIGPQEFIFLLNNAKLIMTDSFHGCVFSFLFEKPFLVYPRIGKEKDMFDRISTLLNKFSLERKYVNSELGNQLFECDYKEGYRILDNERRIVNKFLSKSMHMV